MTTWQGRRLGLLDLVVEAMTSALEERERGAALSDWAGAGVVAAGWHAAGAAGRLCQGSGRSLQAAAAAAGLLPLLPPFLAADPEEGTAAGPGSSAPPPPEELLAMQ